VPSKLYSPSPRRNGASGRQSGSVPLRRGFSLLEVVLVLFLLIALAGLSFPSLSTLLNGSGDKAFLDDVLSAIDDQRSEAMMLDHPLLVVLSPAPTREWRFLTLTSSTVNTEGSESVAGANVTRLDGGGSGARLTSTSNIAQAPRFDDSNPARVLSTLRIPAHWEVAVADVGSSLPNADSAAQSKEARESAVPQFSRGESDGDSDTDMTPVLVLLPSGEVTQLRTFTITRDGVRYSLESKAWTNELYWQQSLAEDNPGPGVADDLPEESEREEVLSVTVPLSTQPRAKNEASPKVTERRSEIAKPERDVSPAPSRRDRDR